MSIALAITLAYAIALWMNWERPYWAGLAVVVISLTTTGESIYKALQRLGGTAVAVVLALVLISLFAQDRWMFAAVVSVWLAFCTWKLQASERWYFWYCSGFIVPLLSMMSGFDSQGSFYIVETRVKETVLGIGCFVLVNLVFSRKTSRAAFVTTVKSQLNLMREFVDGMETRAAADRDMESGSEVRSAIANGLINLPSLHTAAQLESFDIRQRARSWQQVVRLITKLAGVLDRLHLSFEVDPLDGAPRTVAGWNEALEEIRQRLDAIEDLLDTGKERRTPADMAAMDVSAPGNAFDNGSWLHRQQVMAEVDDLTRQLHEAAADVADIRRILVDRPIPAVMPSMLDPERLAIAVTEFVIFWCAFLMYIYLPAIPDGPIVVVMAAVIGMNISRMPWLTAIKVLIPVILAAIYGSIAHILILPRLDGFSELGPLVFVGVFILSWIFHTPELAVGRTIGVVLFMMILQVSNANQQFDAMYGINLACAMAVLLLALTLVQHVPVSWQPERVVLRLLRRYRRCFQSVLANMRWDQPRSNTWLRRKQREYCVSQLESLPKRIETWAQKLPDGLGGKEAREQMTGVADQLYILSTRMRDLAVLRETEADAVWVRALAGDVRVWREAIQTAVDDIGREDWPTRDQDMLEARLKEHLVKMQQLIADVANSGDDAQATAQGNAHMQRVMAAYRGVSYAVLGVLDNAREVSWPRLAETRF